MSFGDIPDWAYDSAKLLMESLKVVDESTYRHCLRVGEMARKFARDMGLNEYQQKVAEFSGIFHDVGKMAISQDIIHKPGKLTAEEYEKMKEHSEVSENIIKQLSHHLFFLNLLPNIRGHHERIDGAGYPDGLTADQIPLIARVILVVDTYDAMSQNRAYRKGLPDEVIYAELKRCSGTQFDPQLVKIFLDVHADWQKQGADLETESKIIKRVG